MAVLRLWTYLLITPLSISLATPYPVVTEEHFIVGHTLHMECVVYGPGVLVFAVDGSIKHEFSYCNMLDNSNRTVFLDVPCFKTDKEQISVDCYRLDCHILQIVESDLDLLASDSNTDSSDTNRHLLVLDTVKNSSSSGRNTTLPVSDTNMMGFRTGSANITRNKPYLQFSNIEKYISDGKAELVRRKLYNVLGHIRSFQCMNHHHQRISCSWSVNSMDIANSDVSRTNIDRPAPDSNSSKVITTGIAFFVAYSGYGGLEFECPITSNNIAQCSNDVQNVITRHRFTAAIYPGENSTCPIHREHFAPRNILKLDVVTGFYANISSRNIHFAWKSAVESWRKSVSPLYRVILKANKFYKEKNVTKLHCRFKRLTPYTDYVASIQSIPRVKNSVSDAYEVKGYWSDAVAKEIQTLVDTPSSPPQVTPGGFTFIPKHNGQLVDIFFNQNRNDKHGPIEGLQLCHSVDGTMPDDNCKRQDTNVSSQTCINDTNITDLDKGSIRSSLLLDNSLAYTFTLNSFTQKGMNHKLRLTKIIIFPRDELFAVQEQLRNSLHITRDVPKQVITFYWEPIENAITYTLYTSSYNTQKTWLTIPASNITRARVSFHEVPEKIGISAEFLLCQTSTMLFSTGIVQYTNTIFDATKPLLPPMNLSVSRESNKILVSWSLDPDSSLISSFLLTVYKDNTSVDELFIKNNLKDVQYLSLPQTLTSEHTISVQSIGINGTLSDIIVAKLPEGTEWAFWWLWTISVVVALFATIGILYLCTQFIFAFKRRCLEPIPIHIPDYVKPDTEMHVKNEASYTEHLYQ